MTFRTQELKVARFDDRYWITLEDIVYEGRDELFVIPAGFKTDFASVPPMVQWLIPSYGKYTLAAIVHDWFCEALNRGNPVVSARDADAIFERIMRELGVPPIRRNVIWVGVRWGAAANPARREGWFKDFPAIVGWSLMSTPVAVVSVVAAVGLTIDRVAEGVVRFFGGR